MKCNHNNNLKKASVCPACYQNLLNQVEDLKKSLFDITEERNAYKAESELARQAWAASVKKTSLNIPIVEQYFDARFKTNSVAKNREDAEEREAGKLFRSTAREAARIINKFPVEDRWY